MNIGILAYRQQPFISANTSIAYLIGEELRSMGHDVTFIGYKQDISQNDITDYHGIPVRFFNDEIEPTPSRIENYFYAKIGGDKLRLKAYSKKLREIVKEKNINALICVIAPIDDALISFHAQLDIPVFLYQLDPFYNLNDIVDKKLKKKFIKILPYFSYVFTTDLLLPEYCEDEDIKRFVPQMSVLQFPKLIKPKYENKRINVKKRLLYSGTLSHTIRNPRILINFSSLLPDDCEVVFCGGCDCREDAKLIKDSKIVYKGYLNQSDLGNEFSEADFLINIGNSNRNQLGSKIVDYIATGKPIINIVQFPECPTISVLEKYEYHITVQAARLQDSSASNEINDFIQNNSGKQYNWETVKKRYAEFTPQFVAARILTEINKSVLSR